MGLKELEEKVNELTKEIERLKSEEKKKNLLSDRDKSIIENTVRFIEENELGEINKIYFSTYCDQYYIYFINDNEKTHVGIMSIRLFKKTQSLVEDTRKYTLEELGIEV